MSTNLISILCGIGGMFAWGIYDFLGGVFSKQIGPFKSFFWSQLAGSASVLLLAVLSAASLHVPAQVSLLFPIAAVLYSAGYLLYFKGLEIGNISIVSATMNLWAVFTMLFAFVFMGQRLSGMQTLGVLMILVGVTLASLNWDDLREKGFQVSSGVKEAVLGAFFFGIFWNISEIISERAGWLLATVLVKAGIVVFVLIFSRLSTREFAWTTAATRTRYAVLMMGVIEAGAVAIVNYGLTIGQAILITPIASALSVVTITLAIVFLKEKVTRLQALGMVTAITGIVVTAF
ncbi:MAG TPA: DMT family transporter [Anaerolineales bacterium]|nr:DMT family transporter [Anaerolineales bacterium]